jgi:hypothetical protein
MPHAGSVFTPKPKHKRKRRKVVHHKPRSVTGPEHGTARKLETAMYGKGTEAIPGQDSQSTPAAVAQAACSLPKLYQAARFKTKRKAVSIGLPAIIARFCNHIERTVLSRSARDSLKRLVQSLTVQGLLNLAGKSSGLFEKRFCTAGFAGFIRKLTKGFCSAFKACSAHRLQYDGIDCFDACAVKKPAVAFFRCDNSL